MREFQVRLQSVQDVQEFVSLSTARGFPVIIRDANNKVNGKMRIAVRRSLPPFAVMSKSS